MVITSPVEGLQEACVRNLLCESGKEWDRDILSDLFESRDVQLIQSIPISYRSIPDKICWRWESNGHFSLRSCYWQLVGEFNSPSWLGWTFVWRWKLPPKIKLFFWQLCCGLLPTRVNLRSRGVDCVMEYGLCGEEVESSSHLFVKCPISKEAWKEIGWAWASCSDDDLLGVVKAEFQTRTEKELHKMVWGF
ncbi:unnamed protein product [Cuscuta epithymum]|uniref:Reverse transcriptase zinc-binding domain-containing protein n=1 Tax=Cuscuta epithymum TaxID=186058 RepID=A0AAV0D4F9_9ASTE|nr:unnamed protein product [Cuscuta epithymum]